MAQTKTQTATGTTTKPDRKQPIQWNVVLLDDDDHGFDYVVRMMQELFAHPKEKGQGIAERVDSDGRAVCLTTHKEHAELKRDQILAYGRDKFIASSKGSMTAVIEPAEFGGDDDDDSKNGNSGNKKA